MNAQELFRRYAGVFNDDKELMYMTESQFVAALAEAIEGGHLQPVVSQPGEAGSKGGPKIMGGVYLDYDAKDDTLHIHFGQPTACKTIDTNENIYIRKTPQGKLSAIEIWDYKKQLVGK